MDFEDTLSNEESEPALNLTPLMDIMFLLVIFFAVSTTFKVFPGISVDLPGAESEAIQEEEKSLTAILTAAGEIYIDGKPIEVGTIELIPSGGEQGRKASAGIDNGTYSIPEEKGPAAGKYKVMISAYQTVGEDPDPEDEDSGAPSEQILPAKFNTESTLEIDIIEGENKHDFNLTP